MPAAVKRRPRAADRTSPTLFNNLCVIPDAAIAAMIRDPCAFVAQSAEREPEKLEIVNRNHAKAPMERGREARQRTLNPYHGGSIPSAPTMHVSTRGSSHRIVDPDIAGSNPAACAKHHPSDGNRHTSLPQKQWLLGSNPSLGTNSGEHCAVAALRSVNPAASVRFRLFTPSARSAVASARLCEGRGRKFDSFRAGQYT